MSLPTTIKALQVQADHTVKLVEIPFADRPDVQHLGDDQVLVRVRAIGLNPTDWKHALTAAGEAGTIAGCDAAGDVVKIGSKVTHLKVGDKASGFTLGSNFQTHNGAFSEYVIFTAAVTFKVPEGQSYAEAAAFPIPHLTAVQGLYLRLGLAPPSSPSKEKKPVLIWGGSTAVGHHAVQLAALSGYKVLVAASPAVADELKKLGAHEVFDYRDIDTPKKIQAAAGPEGVTLALDTVGENGTTDSIIASVSPNSSKNTIISILPPTPSKPLPSNTTADFTLVYTTLGFPFNFLRKIDYPTIPEDKERTEKWVKDELPILLEGWKEGEGSPKLKGQKLRILPGGLESVHEGLNMMKSGNYAREKLVYIVA